MQVTTSRQTVARDGQVLWRLLASDLHLGSPNADLRRLRRDLDAARGRDARILINGDVFDAIDHRDKRSGPNVLVPELRGKADFVPALARYAAKILAPYADLIEIIGVGNHEFKLIKWNAVDPVGLLIGELNRGLAESGSAHRVRHGGNNGYWRTVVDDGGKGRWTHDLYYFHGAGGDAPVTKGTIDVNRKGVCFDYDCITFGHKHNKMFVDDVVLSLSSRGVLFERERKAVQTGSYYRNYSQREDPLDVSYAEEFHAAAKPLGGMFLALIPERQRLGPGASSFRRVRQAVQSDPLPAGA